MNNEIKYYYNRTDEVFSFWPCFVAGQDYDLAKPHLTEDVLEADFLYIQFPNNKNLPIKKYIDCITDLKNINKKIKLIIVCKEEILGNNFEILYELNSNNIFSKNEMFVSSCSINTIDSDIFTNMPIKFAVQGFLSKWRKLVDFSFLKNIKKSKKIICLSRNQSSYRDSLFKRIYKNKNIELFNSENLIKYHRFSPADVYIDADLQNAIENNSIQQIELNKDISYNRMFDDKQNYYEEITNEYQKFYFTIVNESLVKDFEKKQNTADQQISEKTFIPMLTKTIFFSMSHPDYEKKLNEIGIETFESEFGIEYDTKNVEEKSELIIDLMKKINRLTYKEIEEIYNSEVIQNKLKKNYEFIEYWSDQTNSKKEFENFLKNYL